MRVPNKRQKYSAPSKLTAEERQMLMDYYQMTEQELDVLDKRMSAKKWRFGSLAQNLRLSLWAEEDKKINGKTLPGEIRAARFEPNPTRPGGVYETLDRREAMEIFLSKAFNSGKVWDMEEFEKNLRETEYTKFKGLLGKHPEMAERLRKELTA